MDYLASSLRQSSEERRVRNKVNIEVCGLTCDEGTLYVDISSLKSLRQKSRDICGSKRSRFGNHVLLFDLNLI